MIPAEFEYAAPASISEALALLAEHGDDAKVMAGGQSLMPILRMRLNAPEMVIDLGKIADLTGVSEESAAGGDHIRIGAMTTYADVLASDVVREHAGLLTKAVAEVADPQIRHRGTVGGALVHADPAGDVGAPILALAAELVITGADGHERSVAASDFFVDIFETAVQEGELLTAIRIPKHTGWGSSYTKFVRVSHQWSIVAAAATVRAEGGLIAEAKVALTNMGSTPLRATVLEKQLIGKVATTEALREVCAQVGASTNPPSDLNGDADYRRHLAGVLTRRAVVAAAGG